LSALLLAVLASALQVRVAPALAPCVLPLTETVGRDAGLRVTAAAAAPDPPGEVDVVIADEGELTRLLEGGRAVLATAVDLGVARAGIAASADDERRRARRGPQMAVAAQIAGSRNAVAARAFLAHLQTARARARLERCFAAATPAVPAAMDAYGRAIVDWWIPQCSLERNGYNDPEQAVGPPDAVNLGGPDRYRGLVSLGQGGYVTVELGEAAIDRNGPDIRVFQTTTAEPVTLYASAAADGPFVLIGLRVPCGQRLQGVFSRYCDFDLREAGLGLARYVKIEDGEIYPCLEGGTLTEGADIDAVQTLNR
jgi:hypothetical protein